MTSSQDACDVELWGQLFYKMMQKHDECNAAVDNKFTAGIEEWCDCFKHFTEDDIKTAGEVRMMLFLETTH